MLYLLFLVVLPLLLVILWYAKINGPSSLSPEFAKCHLLESPYVRHLRETTPHDDIPELSPDRWFTRFYNPRVTHFRRQRLR